MKVPFFTILLGFIVALPSFALGPITLPYTVTIEGEALAGKEWTGTPWVEGTGHESLKFAEFETLSLNEVAFQRWNTGLKIKFFAERFVNKDVDLLVHLRIFNEFGDVEWENYKKWEIDGAEESVKAFKFEGISKRVVISKIEIELKRMPEE